MQGTAFSCFKTNDLAIFACSQYFITAKTETKIGTTDER